VILSEPIFIGHRIRDIESQKSKLILLTDDSLLVFIEVDDRLLRANKKDKGLYFEPEIQRCLMCHSFEPTNSSSLAPTLSNIIGRKVGSDNFEKYSEALKNSNKTWTKDNLVKFITNPSEFIPGTSMPPPEVNEDQAKKIAAILGR
jgi:cytochrome c